MAFSIPAHAISTEKTYSSGTIDLNGPPSDAPNRTLADFIKDYVDVPKGGIDWKVFSKTKEVSVEGKTKDGYDYQFFKPKFPPDVRKLDGQIVTVKGFMFPLNETESQKLFLFGPFPVSCPFHYHVSPSLVIEVHADKKPVTFSYDPVILKGKLQLVDADPENSTFYKLVDAEIVK
jgi:hypothetical protein